MTQKRKERTMCSYIRVGALFLALVVSSVSAADKTQEARIRMLQAQLRKQAPTITALHEQVRRLQKKVATLEKQLKEKKPPATQPASKELKRVKVYKDIARYFTGPLTVGKAACVSLVRGYVAVRSVKGKMTEMRGEILIADRTIEEIYQGGKKVGERPGRGAEYQVLCLFKGIGGVEVKFPGPSGLAALKGAHHDFGSFRGGHTWAPPFLVTEIKKITHKGKSRTMYVLELIEFPR